MIFILFTLYTIGLTHLLVYESGPFRLLERLRSSLPEPVNFMNCTVCCSVWTSLLFIIVSIESITLSEALLYMFAGTGVRISINCIKSCLTALTEYIKLKTLQ